MGWSDNSTWSSTAPPNCTSTTCCWDVNVELLRSTPAKHWCLIDQIKVFLHPIYSYHVILYICKITFQYVGGEGGLSLTLESCESLMVEIILSYMVLVLASLSRNSSIYSYSWSIFCSYKAIFFKYSPSFLLNYISPIHIY